MGITVLRLGHRPDRDKRITTHVCLTARSFGAERVLVSTRDPTLEMTIKAVVERWGGDFQVKTGVGWKRTLAGFGGFKIHLTMYGERIDRALGIIPGEGDLIIVVGAEKVPRDVYEMVDLNVSVGNQPHSEVAALGVFLDRYTGGNDLYSDLGGELKVVPSPGGKMVEGKD